MSLEDRIETERIKNLFKARWPDAAQAITGNNPRTRQAAQLLYTGFKEGYKAGKMLYFKV